MSHKACIENFYEKVSGALVEDNVGQGHTCLYNLVFDLAEALTSLTMTSLTLSSITSVTSLLM